MIKIYRGGEVIDQYKASDIDFIEVAEEPEGDTGEINGHEYVNLGLPSGLKWAVCNVGADSASAYGDYFAWGEVETKDSYTQNNCLTYNQDLGDISGKPEYDAARAKWGSTWRIPSDTEIEELINNCTWTWTSINDIAGYHVTGPNGNSIFLPAAGYRYGITLEDAGTYGDYWTSTAEGDRSCYNLGFFNGYRQLYVADRFTGQTVRPVSN